MARKLKQSSIEDFSSRIVKVQKLPHGTKVRLYRKKNGRRVRSDFLLKRKIINSSTVTLLDDDMNVRNFLDFARALLTTAIEDRGFEMVLVGPDGNRLDGHYLLRNVRSMAPAPVAGDNEKIFDIFIQLLENAGLEELTMRQMGNLYRELRIILGGTFDQALLTHESRVHARSIGN